MHKLIKNAIEAPVPHDLEDVSVLSEIVETNVRGTYIVSVIAILYGNDEHITYSVELYVLSEWATIENTSYTDATQTDQAFFSNLNDALSCHSDTIAGLIGPEDQIVL